MAPLPPVQLKLNTSVVEVPSPVNEHSPDGHPVPAIKKIVRLVQVTQDPTLLEPNTAKLTGEWQCERPHSDQQSRPYPLNGI